jgi:hypothetical protein
MAHLRFALRSKACGLHGHAKRRRKSAHYLRRSSFSENRSVPMLRAGEVRAFLAGVLALAVILGVPVKSNAGEQLIGTSCTGNKSIVDWDTIGQCKGSSLLSFQRAAPFLAGSITIGTTSLTTGTVLDMGSNTNSMLLPVGTTGQEPTGVAGMIRYNSTNSAVEFYNGLAWHTLCGSPAYTASQCHK